jgi:hypothetical protein
VGVSQALMASMDLDTEVDFQQTQSFINMYLMLCELSNDEAQNIYSGDAHR